MTPTRFLGRLRSEWRPMIALAVPVALGEVGWMALGVVDTMMVGRLSAEAIGALSVGRALFMAVGVFGIGLLLGLDTLISRSHGAGDAVDCRRSLVHGIYLGLLLAPPLTAVVLLVLPLLRVWGIEGEVLELTLAYARALVWGVLPLLLSAAFRRYLQAIGRAQPVMLALISANLVNAAGNWVLIYGKLGAPALGVAGAGWATVLSLCYLALFMFAAILLHGRSRPGFSLRFRPSGARFRELLALGLPVSVQLGLEVGVFALVTMLAARLHPAALAAHQIALLAASVTFMVPLGISSAAAIRVGHSLGRGDPEGAGRAGWTAILLAAVFMSGAALTFVLAPGPLIRIFTADPEVVAVGISLLAVAAFFQMFDGVQVCAAGALRGAGDTRRPMLFNLIAHWGVGLPVGYVLAFGLGWGALGLWIGLSSGLTLVALLLLRVWIRTVRVWGRT